MERVHGALRFYLRANPNFSYRPCPEVYERLEGTGELFSTNLRELPAKLIILPQALRRNRNLKNTGIADRTPVYKQDLRAIGQLESRPCLSIPVKPGT